MVNINWKQLSVKNKTNILKLKEGFIKAPSRVFYMNLDPIAISIYFLFCYVPENFNPSIGYISKVLKIHRNTVFNKIQVLMRSNMLIKRSNGIIMGNKSLAAKYELTDPNDWFLQERPGRKVRSDKGSKKIVKTQV